MGLVDITNISKTFFITTAIFVMVIFSFISISIVQFFSLNKKRGLLFLLLGIISATIYGIILSKF